MSFYFPYNFYPVTGKVNTKKTPRYAFDYTNTHDTEDKPTTATLARHDVWQEGKYSGYFTVSFLAKTPIIVGNTHTKLGKGDNAPSSVEPYKWNGQLALPANSLRGMISSIAETLSQSTLRILDEKYYPAFSEIDPDLIPWKNGRNKLTAAELLFGVVDEDGTSEGGPQNLASRVYFSDAILEGENTDVLEKERLTLKELSSPKPDGVLPKIGGTPADLNAFNHYFITPDNKPVTHQDVLNGSMKNLRPLGRKFYLNRSNLQKNHYNNTGRDLRCMKVNLIRIGAKFTGKIRFNNLSQAELSLLEKSIQPDDHFLHHIGLGKSLGLGALSISNISLNIVDRKARYGLDLLKHNKQSIQPESNNELIDKASLKILTMANNALDLARSNEVRWRNGYREKTRPMPQLYANINSLPLAEKNDQVIAESSAPIKRDPKATLTNTDKNLEDNNSTAAKWLKEKFGEINNNRTYGELSHDEIVASLKGKALSKKYMELPEGEDKTETLALIHKQLEQRNIQRNELSILVEKRYFTD